MFDFVFQEWGFLRSALSGLFLAVILYSGFIFFAPEEIKKAYKKHVRNGLLALWFLFGVLAPLYGTYGTKIQLTDRVDSPYSTYGDRDHSVKPTIRQPTEPDIYLNEDQGTEDFRNRLEEFKAHRENENVE